MLLHQHATIGETGPMIAQHGMPRKRKSGNAHAYIREPYFGFLPAAARALAWRLPLAPLLAPVRSISFHCIAVFFSVVSVVALINGGGGGGGVDAVANEVSGCCHEALTQARLQCVFVSADLAGREGRALLSVFRTCP